MANITTQTIRVDLSTNKVIPLAFTHQNDTARTLEFSMYNKGMPYTMTGNTVKFAYKSPIVDGAYTVITGSGMASGTVSGNKVTVTLPQTYTAISGVGMLTMIITPTSGTVRPVNIKLVVQRAADGADVIASASDFPTTLEEIAEDWMEDNIAFQIDNTLSVSGKAADAKVTGDEINDLKSNINTLTTLKNENIPLRWEQGALNSSNGSEISSMAKIRTQTIDISKYTSVTFNNTSGYKFRTAWLNSNGEVVKDVLYSAERTVTSVSYGFMSRYDITAVRVVLGKTDNSDIVPSDGTALTITGVMEIETKVNAINTTLSKDYQYADTNYKQVPLTDITFSVGNISGTGAETSGYRPYTSFINLDNDMIVKSDTYGIIVFVYDSDGTFISETGWVDSAYIPFVDDRKVRILFDGSGHPNNSASPQIDQIINSDIYIGIKRKKEYIEESVFDVLNNMEGQDGNTLNLAFITDLHVTAFEELPLRQVEVWNRNTNGLARVDASRNIDFVVLGGDYLWNNTNTTLIRAERAYKLLQECFYQFKDKQFALKGNHDDNSIAGNANYIVTDSARYGYLGQQYTNDVNIKYGTAEKSYGYIDFERQKIRALFINTVDIQSYTGQHITGVSNAQLNFFADALNITESGWAIIVFSHHVLVNNETMAIDSEAYLTPTHGGDALWGIIQAFKNKTAYSKVSTLTNYEYSVSVDYQNNGSNEVIACINGHTHRDLSATQDGILLISTTASGFSQTAYDSTGTQIIYTLDTQTETAFDIFSFDRKNETITASRYGAGQNRNWSY